MIEKMKDDDAALRDQFMKQGFPYFSYRYGERARGICRIGKWEEVNWYFDKEKLKNVCERKKRNVTPKKMMKVLKTFTGWESSSMDVHLWLEPLSETEQSEWRSAFAGENVIYDEGC